MSTLAERLHCPRCKGRLNTITAEAINGTPTGSFFCTQCEAVIPAPDDIPDFIGDRTNVDTHPLSLIGDPFVSDEDAVALLARIQTAAGLHWPASLGDVLELGCGGGRLTHSLMQNETAGLIVAADSNAGLLHACRERVAQTVRLDTLRLRFLRLSLHEDAVRDATFDTVLGTDVLSRISDVRTLLATVHRALRPGGRAFFIAPNRRYLIAVCQAVARALVLRNAREQTWSNPARSAIQMIGMMLFRHVHSGDQAALAGLRDRNMFYPERLTELAQEAGFQEAEAIPLDPDRLGGETSLRLLLAAGVEEGFASEVAPLVASAGAPHFSLLSRQDSSALMLLRLSKGVGPSLRSFTAPPPTPTVAFRQPDAALGGLPPRWSIEVTARDTPAGIQLTVDGWCLVNADVSWLRLVIGDVARATAVCLPRPDVHDVLNRQGLYNPLNALCSGLRAMLLFDGVHSGDNQCLVRIEVVLQSGVVVQASTPRNLIMNETITLAQ
ncbi:MAG: class I SAM-dependent methyltransferase [Acetobacteraceae bacterium]|nr:class I SAM-dependent methyltransferase [Pseudomonadota bacterium]